MASGRDKERLKEGQSILMTGGTGFLGSHLLRHLIDAGHKITLLKRSHSDTARIGDLLKRVRAIDIDHAPLDSAFEGRTVDIILHCATDYGSKGRKPWETIDANLILPLKLLHLGRDHGTDRFINTDTILDKRINDYSLSKKHFLDWLQAYSGTMTCINVALEHFYGPDDNDTKFVSSIIHALLDGKPAIELTPGEQKRDFIFVSDVVSAFDAIINSSFSLPPGLHRFEVGTGRAVSIRDIVTLIQRLTGNYITSLDFGAMPYRPNEVMSSQVALSPLRALGWEPRVSLEEGLLKTIQHERGQGQA